MAGLDDAASELESIARHLRAIGDGELLRELTAGMRRAVDPVRGEIRQTMPFVMPKRYAAELGEDTQLSVSVKTTERNPGVTITGKSRSGQQRRYYRLDGGILEHPLFGDRRRWYKQTKGVHPGWFTGPCEALEPKVRAEIENTLDDISVRATTPGP